MSDKYYLVAVNPSGEGMLLTGFVPGKTEPYKDFILTWACYMNIHSWNMPLLFPTLEQIETFHEQAELEATVHICRWISMNTCHHNMHQLVI